MNMREVLVAVSVAAIFLPACQKKHPIKLDVSPRMKQGEIATIAVFPFTSAVHETDDPNNDAPKVIERLFFEELDKRGDYKFVAPNTVAYAAERRGLEKAMEEFLLEWPQSRKPDPEFFSQLADVLKCDAFMIGTVDMWQKDEVDFQEDASPATYVGASLDIMDATTGEFLFQASDEDYLEGLRSETTDRQLVVGASGNVYKDLGERMFKAPPFEDVAQKVVKALVASIPPK